MKDIPVCLAGVENCSYSFDSLFSYIIPEELSDLVNPGMRIMVPFGAGNTLRQAFVFSLESVSGDEIEKLKTVNSVLDSSPMLDDELIKVALYLREHTFCTYFEAAKAVLPGGMCFKTEKLYFLAKNDIPEKISPEENLILSFISSKKDFVRESVIQKKCGLSDTLILRKMTAKGFLSEKSEAFAQTGDLSAYEIALSPDVSPDGNVPGITEKQALVTEYLAQNGSGGVKDICYYTGVGESVVNTLIRKGICVKRQYRVFRSPGNAKKDGNYRKPVLSEEQTAAYNTLLDAYNEHSGKTALLYGITGSGKTSVYLQLVDKVLSEGKTVIVLIPEISLTPQVFAQFVARYGRQTAILHSALSMGERYDEWSRLASGEARIAVGTRSAVFAPVKNLGLIIIDEEQEHTYKSGSTPRYNAKEIARFRAGYNGALTLLASATPSVETYARALGGKYVLTKLKNRYGNATLPAVKTVDVSASAKVNSHFSVSDELAAEIKSNLELGEQSILLVNRRGFNTFVSCPDCKAVMTCPNCSISLTYHSANNRLMCHYCGWSTEYAENCTKCGGQNMRYSGSGTQKVEQEINIRFPEARVLRMDADTTTLKNSHETALTAFSDKKYDILVGTQMVAKGLDFPDVTLVGVLSADKELYNDDFRSAETTFDLITQVVGRAGRGSRHGRAVIQTVTPDNETISLASMQDYDSFYNTEIILRRALVYPPFCDIVTVTLSGKNEGETAEASGYFFNLFSQMHTKDYAEVKLIVLGPISPKVPKINNIFRKRLIIKCRNNAQMRSLISNSVREFMKDRRYRNVNICADVNPL